MPKKSPKLASKKSDIDSSKGINKKRKVDQKPGEPTQSRFIEAKLLGELVEIRGKHVGNKCYIDTSSDTIAVKNCRFRVSQFKSDTPVTIDIAFNPDDESLKGLRHLFNRGCELFDIKEDDFHDPMREYNGNYYMKVKFNGCTVYRETDDGQTEAFMGDHADLIGGKYFGSVLFKVGAKWTMNGKTGFPLYAQVVKLKPEGDQVLQNATLEEVESL